MVAIIDTIGEPKVRENLNKISRIKKELESLEIKLTYHDSKVVPNSNGGPGELKYYQTLEELEGWQKTEENPGKTITPEEINSRVNETEKQAMKNQAHSGLQDVVDNTNAEAGKTDEYDSRVDRVKGSNYHQRGHYFIFYEDGSKEHGLALYPKFDDNQLRDGHTHKTFILEFDKSVQKFVDVYTCIGCGARKQGFTDLHSDYDIDERWDKRKNPSDSWEIIHKGRPFEPGFTELATTKFQRESNGRIMSASGKYCLGNKDHLKDYHVWQGQEIKDSANRTFDKAYGYIPHGGTIQGRLARDIKNEAEGLKKRIPYHINKLGGKNEFTSYADKNIYQQKAMDITIDELLQEREYVIEYFENKQNINEQLEKELKERFGKLISAKGNAYKFLEKGIKQILSSNDITNCENAFDQLSLQSEPQIIKQIGDRQVEKFIREGKVKEISSELGINLTAYNQAKVEIDLLYQKFFDKLGFNKKVENIQQLEQVAQIVIN